MVLFLGKLDWRPNNDSLCYLHYPDREKSTDGILIMYKKLIEGKKAAFFDLDGTIVDTTPYWEKALENVFEQIKTRWITASDMYVPGIPLSMLWKNKITSEQIELENSIEDLVDRTNKAFIKIIEDSDIDTVDGFTELLHELKIEKNFKTALATNSQKEVTQALVDKLGLINAFDVILSGDDVKRTKPDPEILNKAAKTLVLKAKEVLVFEDSPTGSEAAARAGMDIIIIYNERFPKSEYKGKILQFTPDFTPFPGNLDKTYFETVEDAVKILMKLKEEKKKTSPQLNQ